MKIMGKRLRGVIATAAFVAVLIPAVDALANHTPGFDFLVRSNERDVITANYLHDLPYDSDVGWVSGDRLGYRCMYTFLEYDGELVARVTFAAVPEAVGYTVMQTRNGFHEGARYYDGTINTSGSHQTAGPETCIQPGPYEPLAGDPGPLPIITFADAADGHPLEIRDYANPEKAPDAQFKIVSATPQLVVVVIYQAGLPVAAVYYELMPNVTNVTLTSNATPPPPPPPPPPPAATCQGEPATIEGTDSSETISGTSGDDVIAALGGDDVVNGGAGDDLICAGDGNDTVNAGGGDNSVTGGPGNDALNAGSGEDLLKGNAGDDVLKGRADDDTLRGNAGEDTAKGGPGTDDCKTESESGCE